uniref:VDE lipocalin domain-containing protein n=1 Tax=Pseudo-nitzschia australis TaxID=44445 RepID=A0A7S4ATZ9_9STRA
MRTTTQDTVMFASLTMCIVLGAMNSLPLTHGFVNTHRHQHHTDAIRTNSAVVMAMNNGKKSDNDGNNNNKSSRDWKRDLAGMFLGGSFLLSSTFGGVLPPASYAVDDVAPSAGFEEFAAKGGVMQTDPSCFFDQCGDQSKACFTNPSCLKGITCLGNCRGEQLCATQCFARFGSEKLNDWLSCTLEEKECVTTGVKQDTTNFYQNPPQTKAMEKFTPADLEGKWFKVLGYNPKYDNYPCQTNTFSPRADGGLDNDILFRVPKPEGQGVGAWQNNFLESMADSKGPEGKASMTVEGKMFGLTFHEQWYVLGKGTSPDWRVVAYIGDTQQGPYDGAFVYTKEKDTLTGPDGPAIKSAVDAVLVEAGLDPKQLMAIDNSCPTDVTNAGVSKEDASKEKLEWKDVFELTEWFRPGTLKKQADFDPNKM